MDIKLLIAHDIESHLIKSRKFEMSLSTVSNTIENTAFRLCNGAEDCIQVMHLAPIEQEIVRNCVSRYSTPNTFCELLNWLVFRMTNAFNALQGKMSEWQSAKKVIQDHAIEMVIQRGLIDRNPQDELHAIVKNAVVDSTGFFADKLLDLCLYAQDERCTSSAALRQKLQEVDLANVIDHQIRGIIDRIYSRASST